MSEKAYYSYKLTSMWVVLVSAEFESDAKIAKFNIFARRFTFFLVWIEYNFSQKLADLWCIETGYPGLFRVIYYESNFKTYELADSIWSTEILTLRSHTSATTQSSKWPHLLETWHSKVFRVDNFEFELKIKKFKIANSMWLTKIQS